MFIGSKSSKKYTESPAIWKGIDGELLNFADTYPFKIEKIVSTEMGLWKFGHFLPSELLQHKKYLGEGNTPEILLNWSKKLTIRVKLEQLNPTGSYKDRGASVLMSFIAKNKVQNVVQDSSGNAGVSIAAYSRAHQINCTVFVPESTSETKTNQILAYGANLVKIAGDRAESTKAALMAAEQSFYASHCYHPIFFQGTKTMLLEMAFKNNFQMPEYLFLPAGNGTLIIGCSIALKELAAGGFDVSNTKIVAVQTDLCNPLYQKFSNQNKDLAGKNQKSLAEGIAIPNPIRGEEMLQRVKETNGFWISVSESEILTAWKKLATLGHIVESTSAAVFAGISQIEANLPENSKVWTLFSGHGLKSMNSLHLLFPDTYFQEKPYIEKKKQF